MEVQEMGFNGKRIGAKCRTIANVRDGIETVRADASLGYVDTILRDKLVVGRQIDGWNGVLAAVAAAASWGRENAECPAE